MKALLGIFRGLLAIRKGGSLFFELVEEPFRWLWTRALHPLFVAGYRVYLFGKKGVGLVLGPYHAGTARAFAGRQATYAVVGVLAVAVAVSNVSASSGMAADLSQRESSVVAGLSAGDDDATFVVEERDERTAPPPSEVSYLGGQAVSAHESYDEDAYNGTDDGTFEDDVDETALSASYVLNALRAQQPAPEEAPAEPAPEEQPIPEAPKPKRAVADHVVRQGETAAGIARAYGIGLNTLLSTNGLTARSIIRPGQSLRVPSTDGALYTVKSGDTLSRIATLYHADVSEIMSANGIASERGLKIGQELILPGAAVIAPAKPKAVAKAPAPTKPALPVTPKEAVEEVAKNLKDIAVPPTAKAPKGAAMLWPTAVRRVTQYYTRRHTGVDIAGPIGTPIYAADDGVVVYSGWNRGGYGNMLIVDHGNGLYTRYAHATKLLTDVGDSVAKGDVIALMGTTGRSTGPHLHFEVMANKVSARVNPLKYVK